jgi:hypothetical protein
MKRVIEPTMAEVIKQDYQKEHRLETINAHVWHAQLHSLSTVL